MRALDILEKKRDKQELSREEIEFFIRGYTRDEIPDYQAAAFAMAILLNGMSTRETTDLTLAMAHSGDVLDLSNIVPIAVDKHSTGGVGDKTTLVVEPIIAACGLPVGKMSGRGLGFSGGTLDKMESIPGYRVNLTTREFLDQLQKIGLVLTGQTANLAPADGKLYALRDVTGTVPSIPLIASSIMSKKIAAGANVIILDVKWGLGAFMESLEKARQLSQLMVSIARLVGRKAIAVLSDMNQPLGNAIGNTLELQEAIETLHDAGPEDFKQHCLGIASQMLLNTGYCFDEEAGINQAKDAIKSGKAWSKFRELVTCQGGDVSFIDDPKKLPLASGTYPVFSPHSGFIAQVNARMIGETAVLLGAGRAKKGEKIDHGVGIVLHVKVGEKVEKGQPLCTVFYRDSAQIESVTNFLLGSYEWNNSPVEKLSLFYGVIQ